MIRQRNGFVKADWKKGDAFLPFDFTQVLFNGVLLWYNVHRFVKRHGREGYGDKETEICTIQK